MGRRAGRGEKTHLGQMARSRSRVGVEVEKQRRVQRARSVNGRDVVGLGGDDVLQATPKSQYCSLFRSLGVEVKSTHSEQRCELLLPVGPDPPLLHGSSDLFRLGKHLLLRSHAVRSGSSVDDRGRGRASSSESEGRGVAAEVELSFGSEEVLGGQCRRLVGDEEETVKVEGVRQGDSFRSWVASTGRYSHEGEDAADHVQRRPRTTRDSKLGPSLGLLLRQRDGRSSL